MFKYNMYRKSSDSTGGYKVWGFSVQHNDLVVVWGSAIGNKQFKRWTHGSPAEAQREAVNRSSKKVREGYEDTLPVYVEGNDFPQIDAQGWPESHTSKPVENEVGDDPKVGTLKVAGTVLHWNVLPQIGKRSNKKEARALLVKAKRMLDRLINQSQLSGAAFDARSVTVDGWSLNLDGEPTFLGGSLKESDGVNAFLLLVAWKKAIDLAPEKLSLSLCDDNSNTLEPNLKTLKAQLAAFGEDIESVRERAEILGLLTPKLRLTVHDDCEFEDFTL